MPTPLILESQVLTDITTPDDPSVVVVALPIVANVVPAPTLVDGRPQ
jgi:hypothetical protein